MVWSLLEPTPMPVLVAMSVGQVLGTISLLMFGAVVLADIIDAVLAQIAFQQNDAAMLVVFANEGEAADPIMTGAADYADAMDRELTAIYAGKDPQAGLNDVAKQWDAITKRLGADRLKASYAQFLKLPGATSKNTIAALGQAVHIT